MAQFAYGLTALGQQLHALGLTDTPSIEAQSSAARELMDMYEDMGNVLSRQVGSYCMVLCCTMHLCISYAVLFTAVCATVLLLHLPGNAVMFPHFCFMCSSGVSSSQPSYAFERLQINIQVSQAGRCHATWQHVYVVWEFSS